MIGGREKLGTWAADFSGWGFGLPWQGGGSDRPRDQFRDGKLHDNVAHIRRFLMCYFRFCFQRIIVPTTGKLTRPELRRAERTFSKPVPEDGYVKVMRLRRMVEAEKRGEKWDGEYRSDHQWIVDGYWMRAYCSTLGPARNPDGSWNEESHRDTWIEAHVAGNPYGPLIVGQKVVAAVR